MTASDAATPQSLGYRMPAEWEPHAATWLAWPHNASDWPGKFAPIPWVYCEIVRQLARRETVHIAVEHDPAAKRARGQLAYSGVRLDRVHFHTWPTNRVWTRDSGPIFITQAALEPSGRSGTEGAESRAPRDAAANHLAVTNWKFNAWAKYDDWREDDQLPLKVAKLLGLHVWTPYFSAPRPEDPGLANEDRRRVVLEGGSIDVNGAGALLTTEECLLGAAQQRNPGWGRESLERVFHEYLGVDQVLWLNRGIAGDDTHGHVDDIARFVSANTIVTAVEPNREDENHLPLEENLDRLRAARNLQGEPFRIVELPMPAPVVFKGQRLPASYANFYLANGVVLAPTFNDANDRKALNLLAELFPLRQVVGIHAGDLIWGLGALHCMTQQQPRS